MNSFTPSYLADFVKGQLQLKKSALNIKRISTIESADSDCLIYITTDKYLPQLKKTNAGLALIKKQWQDACPSNAIIVDDPLLAFAQLSHLFDKKTTTKHKIDKTAIIDSSADIASDVTIGAYSVIGSNVSIGSGTVIGHHCVIEKNVTIASHAYLHSRVTLLAETTIGKNCQIHSGTVIGSDGFGNAKDKYHQWHKIAQLGAVVIGNDVEIGANTTIDRGTIDNTVIKDGVKIDNLVHIAHNVCIGKHSAITACVAIAGSTKIGDRVLIGGNSGIANHLTICSDVLISGQSAVDKDITQSGVYTGFVSLLPHKQWQRNALWLTKLDKMARFLNIKLKHLQKD